MAAKANTTIANGEARLLDAELRAAIDVAEVVAEVVFDALLEAEVLAEVVLDDEDAAPGISLGW